MQIDAKNIHLWTVLPYEIQDETLLSKYRDLLSDEECKRMDRFLLHRDRLNFLVSRALMRSVLSNYTGVKPTSLCFKNNPYGRPELEMPGIDLDLRFNLSHTDGCILFAVTVGNDIGVDVESTLRPALDDASINRYFASEEIRYLRESTKHRTERFFELWTLKESYIKAKGMGLSLPLESFCFGMPGEHGVSISFDETLDENPNHWRFWLMQPTKQHKAALALYIPSEACQRLGTFQTIPLEQTSAFDCCVLRMSSK